MRFQVDRLSSVAALKNYVVWSEAWLAESAQKGANPPLMRTTCANPPGSQKNGSYVYSIDSRDLLVDLDLEIY